MNFGTNQNEIQFIKGMNFLGTIPARYASTRFPGKPLVQIQGTSMIERVYKQALKSKKLSEVIVATDDDRIYDHVKNFGGNVMMTSADHPSGTDRCAEVLSKQATKFDVVINIQGDEPFIQPEQIDLLVSCFENKEVQIATLIKKIISFDELKNPNTPKVVIAQNGDAIYFSRQVIPFKKDVAFDEWINHGTYYKHIGIYGYKAEVLPRLTNLSKGNSEQSESLEQLRWLENGFHIRTKITEMETIAIDTPDDLEKIKRFWSDRP